MEQMLQQAVWGEERRVTLCATTKITVTSATIKGTEYERMIIHIPSKVWHDSQFPFKEDDELKLLVDPKHKRIVLEA